MNKDRSWIEIDQDHLRHNYVQLKKMIKRDTTIIAVVKSNAYGHGFSLIVPYLESLGIKHFAVATLDEAIYLRNLGIKGEILILGYTALQQKELLLSYDLSQTVYSYDYACQLAKGTKVHIKIDTGMHRLGIDHDDLEQLDKIISLADLQIKGVFSHLASSELVDDWHDSYNIMQLERFAKVHDYLKDRLPLSTLFHILASYGLINYPQYQFNCVRCGMLFYGFLSSEDPQLAKRLDMQPVLSLKSRIAQIKKIKEGEYVGYDNRYQAKEDIMVAVIPIGYYDGIVRSLSNTHHRILINGKPCEIIGNICMDQLMVDVSNVSCHTNDEACLIGEQLSAEKMAKHAGCLTNELLSRLSLRNVRMLK